MAIVRGDAVDKVVVRHCSVVRAYYVRVGVRVISALSDRLRESLYLRKIHQSLKKGEKRQVV